MSEPVDVFDDGDLDVIESTPNRPSTGLRMRSALNSEFSASANALVLL